MINKINKTNATKKQCILYSNAVLYIYLTLLTNLTKHGQNQFKLHIMSFARGVNKCLQALLENSYHRAVVRWLSNLFRKGRERFEEHTKATIFLPYVCVICEALKWVWKLFGIRTVMKHNQTLMQKTVHAKDTIAAIERTNVVYRIQIPCVNCHITYIKEPKRKLDKRLYEHKGAFQEIEVNSLLWLNRLENRS